MSCSDECYITDNFDMGGKNLTIFGHGNVTLDGGNITNWLNVNTVGLSSVDRCSITCVNGGCFK